MTEIKELTLEVSHFCPSECGFCSSKNCIFDIGEDVRLSKEDVAHFIDKFNPEAIRWSGGEPFAYLDEKWIDLVDDGIEQRVTTCARYTQEISDECLRGLDEIRVSVYDCPRKHNEIVGSEFAFKDVLNFVARVRRLGIEPILTSPILSERQLRDVEVVSDALDLELRLTGLVPAGGWKRPNISNLRQRTEWMDATCSLGRNECGWDDKRLVLPNGEVIHCATEKLGYECPYRRSALYGKE